MRLLAASDLHGNRTMFRALPSIARERGVDAVVLAGDLLGSPKGHTSEEEAQRADAAMIIDALGLFHIHGHIHEAFGQSGIHFNVACGRKMRAMLIDVERIEHTVIV